jgi:phenylalanyl-tRNA synthetase beta chain
MRIPISWLKDYVDLREPVEALAERLTLAGLEVEAIHHTGEWWDPATLVVGRITAVAPHPSADRLALVEVEHGPGRSETVVTGAPDMLRLRGAAPLPVLKVAFARAGAVLIDAHAEGSPRPTKVLEPAEIRGVRSAGMVCSERELGLSDEHESILLLAPDAPVGRPLREVLGGEVLDIALTPDLARCMSVVGVAREVAALTGAALRLPDEPPAARQHGAAPAETAAPAAVAARHGSPAPEALGDTASRRRGKAAPEAGPEPEAEVQILDPRRCHRYIATVVRGVAIGESPAWMRERLRAAGMQPIDNVVDVTNYVMLEYGQPLHAFDYDLLASRAAAAGLQRPSIRVGTATPGETLTTLDGVEHVLDGSELLIADAAGPLGVAGVMGGLESGISAGTRNVLLEAATFDGVAVRQAARQLKLHTEASSRFTRGIPATLNEVAVRRAVGLFERLAGGRLSSVVDCYPVPQVPRRAWLTASEVRRQLGVSLAPPEIRACLERLEFAVETIVPPPGAALDPPPGAEGEGEAAFGLHVEPGEPVLRCTAPWYRLDVEMPADLTEEVARMIGYAAVPPVRLADELPAPLPNPLLVTEERIRDVLVACGMQEHIHYTLTTIESHDQLGLPPLPKERYVTIDNPLSTARRVMRRSMLVSAVEGLAASLRYTDRVRAFEVGRVYLPEQGDGIRPREERRLSLLLAGPRRRPSVHADPAGVEAMDFFDLKGVVEALLGTLGWLGRVDFVARPGEAPFGPRCAEIVVRGGRGAGSEDGVAATAVGAAAGAAAAATGTRLGILGELHPEVAERFGLGGRRVCAAEVAIEPLVKTSWQREVMAPISSYPAVVEDLAFVVRDEVTAHDLAEVIRGAGAPLLAGVELFDLYRGEPLPAESKSLAFQLTFQSQDATLGSAEVAAVRERIEQAVAAKLGGKLRK